MARPLITDEMWQQIRPYLPVRPKSSHSGRPPVSDRSAIIGILFVLKTGIAWKDLPREMGCGCGMTCLRRLRLWQRIGVWDRIRQILQRPDFGLENLDWEHAENSRFRQKQITFCADDVAEETSRRSMGHTQLDRRSEARARLAEVVQNQGGHTMKTTTMLTSSFRQPLLRVGTAQPTRLSIRSTHLSHLHGVILAGVHPWGETLLERICPRPLLPVVGRLLVKYAVDWLCEGAVRTVSVCGNNDTAVLRQSLEGVSDLGLTVDYYTDHMPRGPAGCLRDAAFSTHHQVFLVTDVSIITRVDIGKMLKTHQESGASVTVAVTRLSSVKDGARHLAEPLGMYVVSRDALDLVPSRGYQDIKEWLIPRLRACGKTVVAHYVEDGSTLRVTGAASYAAACSSVLHQMSSSSHIGDGYNCVGEGWVHQSAVVAKTAKLMGSVFVGPRCVIQEHALVLGPVSLDAECVVGRRAIVSHSFVWQKSHIGAGAIVDRCIVTNDSPVEPNLVMRSTIWSRGQAAPID